MPPLSRRARRSRRGCSRSHATRRSRRGVVGPMPSWTRQPCPRYRTPQTILRVFYRRRTGPKRYASPCLAYYHGKSVKEIAEIVSISEATVKTRMFYARRKLAELVETK